MGVKGSPKEWIYSNYIECIWWFEWNEMAGFLACFQFFSGPVIPHYAQILPFWKGNIYYVPYIESM